MIWIILSIFLINAFIVHWIYLWFEYRYHREENISFAEYIYDGIGVSEAGFIFWLALFLPIISLFFIIASYFLDYKVYIDSKKRNYNPFRLIMKILFRRKYLLERVSKEI